MKLCIITNIPVPYRIPIFNNIAKLMNDDFLVIYAAQREPNRLWSIDELNFNHIYLKENIKEKSDGFNYVHNNPDIFKHLIKFNPDYIITTGFNPTHLYGWLYCKLFFKKHIYWSDGTIFTEKNLGLKHKLLRKIVFNTTYSFLGPSEDNKKLYMSYGVKERQIFKTHLCIDNKKFKNEINFDNRKYDLMFSGQFTDRKIPFFFLDIIKEVSKRKNLNILMIGNGPLKDEVFRDLNNINNITFDFPGFVSQDKLPYYYSMSKLFLFTTKLDAWGVVANESLASGTPVLVTPYAGVANDLVINNYNGFVLDIEVKSWAEKVFSILEDKSKWKLLSKNSYESVLKFNYENAMNGILNSCNFYKNKGIK